jgi:predicted dienelactone hydrolase
MACFYPIDPLEYASKIEQQASWLQRKHEQVTAQQHAYKQWFKINVPYFLLRPQQTIKMDAIKDADLAQDFASGKKQLHPVLFSHGIGANNGSYTGLFIDLASQGYIVFAPNHSDGSCMQTQNSQGQSVPLDSLEYYQKEKR